MCNSFELNVRQLSPWSFGGVVRRSALSLLAMGCLVGNARGDLITYWNFNNLVHNANNGTVYSPDLGTGEINLVGWTSAGIDATDGTGLNTVAPDPAGFALELKRSENNGAMLVVSTDFSAYADPVISFADRRNDTGFDHIQISWSTDGMNFTDFGPGYDPGSGDYEIHTVNFSSVNALDGASTAYFKFTFSGADDAAGLYDVDNIQVKGTCATAIPEPSSAAFCGAFALIVLVWVRARRKSPCHSVLVRCG